MRYTYMPQWNRVNLYKVISFESLGTFMWDTMQGAATKFHNKTDVKPHKKSVTYA